MTMINHDNPAARLLNILEEGKKFEISKNCKSVWRSLLDVPAQKDALLMSRLGKVMELPEYTVLSLQENFPQLAETWNHWSMQVNKAFLEQNINGQWQSFIAHIDTHSINYLKLSSDLLQGKTNTKLITDNDIENVRTSLNNIISEILSSGADDEIKKYLIRNLRKIITSIEEYKITGALPILDAVDSTLGHAHINKSYMSFLKDTELGQKLLDTLGAAASVVTIAAGLPQISQNIQLLVA